MQPPHTLPPGTHPPSLARRCAAWSLDAALIALPVLAATSPLWLPRLADTGAALEALLEAVFLVMFEAMPGWPMPHVLLADPALLAALAGFRTTLGLALLWIALPFALAFCIGCGALEARYGATPGKRALGLRVSDTAGGRLPLSRCLLRQAAGLLSWLSLHIGHLLALAPPQYQALHDRIAGAVVSTGTTAPLPGWAYAWLGAQVAGLLAAGMALAIAMQRMADAVVLRVLG